MSTQSSHSYRFVLSCMGEYYYAGVAHYNTPLSQIISSMEKISFVSYIKIRDHYLPYWENDTYLHGYLWFIRTYDDPRGLAYLLEQLTFTRLQ